MFRARFRSKALIYSYYLLSKALSAVSSWRQLKQIFHNSDSFYQFPRATTVLQAVGYRVRIGSNKNLHGLHPNPTSSLDLSTLVGPLFNPHSSALDLNSCSYHLLWRQDRTRTGRQLFLSYQNEGPNSVCGLPTPSPSISLDMASQGWIKSRKNSKLSGMDFGEF